GLQARVPALDDVPRTSLRPLLPFEVPVDDVPPTSSQPELDRGRVHDDPVPHRDVAGQLSENVRTLVPLTQVDLDALQPRPLHEERRHLPRPERRHVLRLEGPARTSALLQTRDQPFDAVVARLERVL